MMIEFLNFVEERRFSENLLRDVLHCLGLVDLPLASFDWFGLGVFCRGIDGDLLRYLRLRKLDFLKNQKNV